MNNAPLGEVVEVVGGSIAPSQVPIGGLVVGLEHVMGGTGMLSMPDPLTEQVGSAKRTFVAGDLLFGKLRPSLRKVAVAPCSGFCTPELVVLRPLDPADTWFLWSVLRSDFVARQVDSHVAGASLPRIGVPDLLRVELPWPGETLRNNLASKAERIHKAAMRVERARSLLAEADRALAARVSRAHESVE